jgi:hypothetical protein
MLLVYYDESEFFYRSDDGAPRPHDYRRVSPPYSDPFGKPLGGGEF